MTAPIQCDRKGKWIGGCRFEGRYETGRPTISRVWGGWPDDQVALIEASKPRLYVREVCRTCGCTIERYPSPSTPGEGA